MVKYFWSESNGVDRPTVNYKEIAPEVEYYVGMPLKIVDAETVEPTDGDPDYICMATYNKENDAAVLQIAVMEVFPDAVYERWNEDGSIDEVRFGGGTGGDLLETVETEVPLEITWGGNVNTSETVDLDGAYLVKVSDKVLTRNDLVGSIVTYVDETGEATMTVTEESIVDGIEIGMGLPALCCSGDPTQFSGNNLLFSVYENGELGSITLTTGVWFFYFGANEYVKSLTCPNVTTTETKTQLKTSLLPEHLQFGETVTSAPLNITWDGNTDGKEVFGAGGTLAVKVSDIIDLTIEQLYGSTLTICNGDGVEEDTILDSESVGDMAEINGAEMFMCMGGGSTAAMIVYGDTSSVGMSIPKGIWFVYSEDYLYTKSLSNPNVTITQSELEPLDEKYIPELSQITLISPSGTKFKVTVDDTGALTVVEV